MSDKYRLELELAPHVDPEWASAFLIELRLQEVPGDRIGDALAEVEAHVAESGETAAEAFGDPAEYAKSLGLKARPTSGAALLGTMLSLVPFVLALDLVWDGAAALRAGKVCPIEVGQLTSVGLFGVVLVVFAVATGPTLRLIGRCRSAAGPVVGLVAVLIALPSFFWSVPVFTIPARWALLVGAAILLASAPVDYWTMSRLNDPVTPPLPGPGEPDDAAAAAREERRRRLQAWLFAAMFPLAGLMVAMVLLVAP
ncbi:MAG: hypothetical protein LBR33_11855 [Propionibacteriaceae bacterium]|jgi:hypothetical protein|nr:hypothetical protein [Propionibacteriaceae bacterium]